MPVPTRPSTGGPIESSWGQETHDGVFTPAGGSWTIPNFVHNKTLALPLDAADDPSGWLAGGDGTRDLITPTDGDGKYLVSMSLVWVPSAGTHNNATMRFYALINDDRVFSDGSRLQGAQFFTAPNDADNLITATGELGPLVAGDVVTFRYGVDPDPADVGLTVSGFVRMTRLGRTIGLTF